MKTPTLKRSEDFDKLFGALVEGGLDVALAERQTEIRLYTDSPSGWCLVLGINGTWKVE